MSTTENERLELYELAKHEVGDRFAELTMKSLPPEPDDLARKVDLAAVHTDLRAEITAARSDLGTEIAAVRTDLGAEIAAVRTDLGAEIADVRSDLRAAEQRLDAKIDVMGAALRVEMRDLTSAQTRTMMLGLVGSITALTITELVIGAFG